MRQRALLGLSPVTVAALACLSAACGGGDKPSTTTVTPKDHDAGSGSEPYDGSVAEPRPDAGSTPSMPGDPDPGLDGSCAIDSNKIYSVAKRAVPFSSTPLAVDPVHSRFVLPYVAEGSCLDSVHWASMAGAAASGAPMESVALETCALVRDAAASALGDQWLIASTDNRDAPYDVWVGKYDGTSSKGTDAQRISQNSHVETSLGIATLSSGDKALVAYADQDKNEGQGLYVRPLDADGKPTAEAQRIEQSSSLYYTGLSLKPMGTGAGLAYVRYSLDYKTSEIVFVALNAQGKPLRDPWVLAANAGPSPSVDFIIDAEGGGIVYSRAEASTGRQIWFQQIDSTGVAAIQSTTNQPSPVQRIVNSPQRGIDVSMTKLRAGYIMTYRALPTGSETRAMLRVYFLDRFGAVIGSSDVSYTSQGGGRTAAASANDGRVALAWNEVEDDGSSTLKMVRLPCLGGN